MTFTVDDFEDYAVGTTDPGQYTGFSTSEGFFRVSDDEPIEGDKSYLFKDEGGGRTGVRHPISVENIAFAIDINLEAPLVGDKRQTHISARKSNGDYAFSYLLSTGSGGPFEVFYKTNHEDFQQNQDDPTTEGDKVGELSVGFHTFQFTNPSTSFETIIDGAPFHAPGDTFSDFNEFEIWADDQIVRIDASVGFSQFVFHEGARVALDDGGDNTYVFQKGFGDVVLILDSGKSTFTKIDGTGIGFE